MNALMGSIFVGAVFSGMGMLLGLKGAQVYRPEHTRVVAAAHQENIPQSGSGGQLYDADEVCARTPGCQGFATFFPAYQQAVIDQWLALYAHLDLFLQEYEKRDCGSDREGCIQMIQKQLFAVSGYGFSEGRAGFTRAWEQRMHTSKPFASEQSRTILSRFHEPFNRLEAFGTRLGSPSFVAYASYPDDIVHLLRGYQYWIKRTLLELDHTGKLVPWNVGGG